MNPPDTIEQLEELLSRPSDDLLTSLMDLQGDLLILGVAGKMGPSLARMARRGLDRIGSQRQRVIGVSRFSDSNVQANLESYGIQTISADLLDERALAKLPNANNVLFVAGTKFGTTGQEPLTWATNAYLPGIVARRFSRSRIVALSTGNVYGPVPLDAPSRERDPLNPLGEYAMSCLGRERVFQHFSRRLNIPITIVRLNYATEMRYGVLVDLARMVLDNRPVPLEVAHANVIWQADACDWILRSFLHCSVPAKVLNVAGPEVFSCRDVARRFGKAFQRDVQFLGSEGAESLLSDASEAIGIFGRPRLSLDELIEWTAHWIARGLPVWDKPTEFHKADGEF